MYVEFKHIGAALPGIVTGIAGLASFTIICGFLYRKRAGRCYSENRLDGKTVIITGASAGIGKAAAFDFAERGGRVIMGCRNIPKANRIAEEIISKTGNRNIVVMKLEVSDLNSVRKFAEEFIQNESRLDILVNNAGAAFPKKLLSAQGFELTYATNHLGHFLLTNLLLDRMKKNKDGGRIINVSSSGHGMGSTTFEDLHFENRSYSMFLAYGNSKLFNILFANELARKLEGTGITSNSMHPGLVSSEMFNKENKLRGKFFEYFAYWCGKSIELGAQTIIYLAVSDDVKNVSGQYFKDCKISSRYKNAKNEEAARRLWEISANDCKLT